MNPRRPPEIPVLPPAPVVPRRIPNWVVAVGTAVAVLVLIGGVTLLLDGSSTVEVVEEPMPTVATTTPTTVPDVTPSSVPDGAPTSVPGTTIPMTPIPDLSASGLLASGFINEVGGLAPAPDGAIWAATRGGVVRWDTGARSLRSTARKMVCRQPPSIGSSWPPTTPVGFGW